MLMPDVNNDRCLWKLSAKDPRIKPRGRSWNLGMWPHHQHEHVHGFVTLTHGKGPWTSNDEGRSKENADRFT